MLHRESWREAEFWSRVEVTVRDDGSEHWLWTGERTGSGYGWYRVSIGGHRYQQVAHRLAWELIRGPIPEGRTLDHTVPPCGIKHCVNVRDCLEPVSNPENVRRAWRTRVGRLLAALASGSQLLGCVDREACFVALSKGLVHIDERGLVGLTAAGLARLPKGQPQAA